jgi:glutamyl-tRNA synthetase
MTHEGEFRSGPARVRFAPSPTGYLHIGNARTALINALVARSTGGRFILRLDDTDIERSRPEYADAIREEVAWLGIAWDETFQQSDRLDRYGEAFERLRAKGLIYPAYETAEELDKKRKRLQMRGMPPVYDRAALKLNDDERKALESAGRRPHWRFRLSGETVAWQDGVRGEAHIETASLSDPVLAREDGTVLYTFASVVDDIDSAVTYVIRGEDHVANTAVQIELFKALGANPPAFAHHNLIVSVTGEEMSKRKGSLSIRSFREAGAEAMAVASVAVLTGTSEATRVMPDLDALASVFALPKLSRAQTRFDPAEIMQLTAKWLHDAPYEAVAQRLEAIGVPASIAPAFWLAVRGNLSVFEDAKLWLEVVSGAIDAEAEDRGYLGEALALLPQGPFDENSWSRWTETLKTATGRKGRELFMPLRKALTGLDHGPDMKQLLPLIGRERTQRRLKA